MDANKRFGIQALFDVLHFRAQEVGAAARVYAYVIARSLNPVNLFRAQKQQAVTRLDDYALRSRTSPGAPEIVY
jgi:archaellum biogenesis protein FlaJ (TadC family)